MVVMVLTTPTYLGKPLEAVSLLGGREKEDSERREKKSERERRGRMEGREVKSNYHFIKIVTISTWLNPNHN